MAVLESPMRMFTLESISLDPFSLPSLARPVIASSSFSLPALDGSPSGSDRLLSSLKWHKHDSSNNRPQVPDRKGKTAAEASLEESPLASSDDERRLDWEALLDKGAGGHSRTRQTFAVLNTWDRLSAPKIAEARPDCFLSSVTSPVAFEAFLSKASSVSPQPEDATTNSRGTRSSLPTNSPELLNDLLGATLGSATRETVLWDKDRARFVSRGRPDGLDQRTAGSAVQTFLDIATALRRLEMIIDRHSTRPLTATHHALFNAVSTYLSYIKSQLAEAIAERRDHPDGLWARWTERLNGVRQLLAALSELLFWLVEDDEAVDIPSRASTLLGHIYAHCLARWGGISVEGTDEVSLCLAYILQYASEPIFHLLHQWLGLADSSSLDQNADQTSQPWADLGITRSARSSSAAHGELGQLWDYTFSSKRMPPFVPKESRRTIFEAGKSLRELRVASGGGHPLCSHNWNLKAEWAWGGEAGDCALDVTAHKRRVQREIDQWRRHGKPPRSVGDVPHGMGASRESVDSGHRPKGCTNTDMESLWNVFDQEPGAHWGEAQKASLWTGSPLDNLDKHLARFRSADQALLPAETPTVALFVSRYIMQPLLAHSTLITTSLVSLYLDDLRLLDHLDILRAFWLGGDVGFSERVSGALFGKEEAGAGEALGMGRRARTRARLGLGAAAGPVMTTEADDVQAGEWGIGLGIGLSERAKWPPGGSELAYALRTTLVDQYDAGDQVSPAWHKIEDRVSFALQDLPEDGRDGQRAQWMDPQAIEALDFLVLSYSPEEAIRLVLPQSILTEYQTVHNFLLRICRVDTVLRSMYYDIAHQRSNADQGELKTGVDNIARKSGSEVRARWRGTTTSRGVFADHTTATRLDLLRYRMTHFISALHRYVLDVAVGIQWDKMRRRLQNLRRRIPGQDHSRPATPLATSHSEYFDLSTGAAPIHSANEPEDEDMDRAELQHLRSLHSLIVYHSATMDKVLRACLLSDHTAHRLLYKVLMRLFGLVLDLGKTVKEVQRGVKGQVAGAEVVARLATEWHERETSFLKAVEKLAARSSDLHVEKDHEEGDAHDMRILLQEDEETGTAAERRLHSGGELQELLLRLRLNVPRM